MKMIKKKQILLWKITKNVKKVYESTEQHSLFWTRPIDRWCNMLRILDWRRNKSGIILSHTHTHSYMEYLFLRVRTQFSLLILSEFKQINLFHLKSSENHRLTLIFLETPTKTSAAGSFFWLTSRLKTPLTNKSTKAILLGLLRNCSEQLLCKTHVNNFF